jgi:hypothetical protein
VVNHARVDARALADHVDPRAAVTVFRKFNNGDAQDALPAILSGRSSPRVVRPSARIPRSFGPAGDEGGRDRRHQRFDQVFGAANLNWLSKSTLGQRELGRHCRACRVIKTIRGSVPAQAEILWARIWIGSLKGRHHIFRIRACLHAKLRRPLAHRRFPSMPPLIWAATFSENHQTNARRA